MVACASKGQDKAQARDAVSLRTTYGANELSGDGVIHLHFDLGVAKEESD